MTEVILLIVAQWFLVGLIFLVAVVVSRGRWWKKLIIGIVVAVIAYFLLDSARVVVYRHWANKYAPIQK